MPRPTLTAAALLVSAALAAGCGDDDEPAAVTGASAAPAAQRIVTLTDQNALLPLLELGVKPVASAGQLLEGGKGKFRRTEGFDTSGITFVGDVTAPDVEQIAQVRPDLIVGYEFNEDVLPKVERLAPAKLVNIFDRPLPVALEEFARIVGKEDRARELRAAYEERVAEFKRRLAPVADELSVSVISAGGQPTAFARADDGQALKAVLDDVGVRRPAEQTGERNLSGDDISLERLRRHDADVVLVIDYSGDGSSEARPITASRSFENLAATRAGQAHTVDGTKTVGAAWARMQNFLDVLEQRLLAPGVRTDVVQEDTA